MLTDSTALANFRNFPQNAKLIKSAQIMYTHLMAKQLEKVHTCVPRSLDMSREVTFAKTNIQSYTACDLPDFYIFTEFVVFVEFAVFLVSLGLI